MISRFGKELANTKGAAVPKEIEDTKNPFYEIEGGSHTGNLPEYIPPIFQKSDGVSTVSTTWCAWLLGFQRAVSLHPSG